MLLSVAANAATCAAVTLVVAAKALDLHVVEVIRGPGGRDVALYVGRFERGLGRGHLERLEEGRVDHTDHEGHEGPDAHGEDGQRPSLAPDVEEQDGGGEDRDDDEQGLRRQAGVHVGVPGAVDIAVVRVHQTPPLQDVAGRLGQRDERQEHREVGLDRRAHAGDAPLGQDPAVEVVEDDGDDERDDQDGQRPVDDEVHERELEDVEADVLVELRILDPEVAAMAKEDPVLPFADRARGRDERHDERQGDVEASGVGPHDLLVAADDLVLLHGAEVVAGQAVADDQVDPHDDEEDGAEDPEEPELDHQQGGEHVVVPHRGEPEAVGVDVGQGPQGGQQDDQDDDGARPPTTGPVAASGAGGEVKGPWGYARGGA